MRKIRTTGLVSPAALESAWQRQATAAAIAGARGVVRMDGPVPPGTPVGFLDDQHWGWIISAVLFAWIRAQAQRAAAENIDTETCARVTGLEPEPWDAGAVAAILPELADASSGKVDWAQPVGKWPREMITGFLLGAMSLVRKAMIARDLSDKGVIRGSSASTIARQANAAAGGPLMTADEWNDEVATL
jgi:hypothetical protein